MVDPCAAVFERFRAILHEGQIDRKVQYTIEALFGVRKNQFKDNPAIPADLDLVESEDQIPHELPLDGEFERDDMLGTICNRRFSCVFCVYFVICIAHA